MPRAVELAEAPDAKEKEQKKCNLDVHLVREQVETGTWQTSDRSQVLGCRLVL